MLEHWHEPVMFDAHFLIKLLVYGLGAPFLVWLLLRWLVRTLAIDLPTKRVQTEASMAERQRIARDLHDKLAQNLAYLHFKLDQLHASSDAPLDEIVSIQDELAHMRQIADEAYEQVRATLTDLRSADTAIPIDLQTELQERARKIVQQENPLLQVTCSVTDVEICQILKRTVLAIAHEAATNVAKHARASNLSINLAPRQKDIVLTIVDNGSVFDTRQIGGHGHYGLEIMRERAEEIGGQFAISAVQSGGTRVEASFPNTILSESLLQTCFRLGCGHLDACTEALARQTYLQAAQPSATPSHGAPAPGYPNENPAG